MNIETKIHTLSLVAGTESCNARCPFCVSKMTPPQGIGIQETPINWERFALAARLAKEGSVNTAMITGKGEPTLFPGHISKYLENLADQEEELGFTIPAKELQTNAIMFEKKRDQYDPLLEKWHSLNLKTVAISIVHFEEERNREIYLPYSRSYIDLPGVLDNLHEIGLRTRLACVLVNRYIDSPNLLEQLINFATRNKVEELTIRPVNKPDGSVDSDVYEWTSQHQLKQRQQDAMRGYLEKEGTVVNQLPFGATVYDVHGQNVCLTNSLTKDVDTSYMRQLIFFPNGRLATDWTEEAELV